MAKKLNTASSVELSGEVIISYLERFERLEVEKTEVTDQQKELMAEITGGGYDGKIFKKLLALRKKKPDQIMEEDMMLDQYKAAIGME